MQAAFDFLKDLAPLVYAYSHKCSEMTFSRFFFIILKLKDLSHRKEVNK